MTLKREYHILYVCLTVLIILGFSHLTKSTSEQPSTTTDKQSTKQQIGYCGVKARLTVKCTINNIYQLVTLMAENTNVTDLDLSHNQLQDVPNKSLARYSQLEHLSLAYNNIQDLTYEAFYGLDNLITLNLSKNPLRSFIGQQLGLLPSLSTLDATEITDWKPDKQFLQLRMLRIIFGLSWSPKCMNCSLYRNHTTNQTWLPKPIIDKIACKRYTYLVDNKSLIAQLLNNTNFQFHCNRNSKCKYSYFQRDAVSIVNPCWIDMLLAISISSFIGFLAALLNLIAFVNILTSKILRKNVSLLFLCNMALSDCLIGIYTTFMVIYLNSQPFESLYRNLSNFCWKIGFVWMLAQSSAVCTTFYLTLERYLVIVYSLRPDVRITRRMAIVLIMVCWLISMFLAFYALYYNFYISNVFCVPLQYNSNSFHPFYFSVAILATALTLFLITFIFYIHIYITVRQAAQNAGAKRESKLAKRIAVLVLSNIFFFFFPVMCFGIPAFIYSRNYQGISDLAYSLITNFIPTFCLSVNSCLNPLLNAFRNDRFTSILKGRLSRIRQYIMPIVPVHAGSSRVNPTN